jgi:lipoprotein signal peptidase
MPVSSTIKDQISSALGGSSGSLTSLLNNYSLILLGIPIAIIVAVIVMLIIRCTASFFIYMLILLAVGALSAAGVYLLLAPASTSPSTQTSPRPPS